MLLVCGCDAAASGARPDRRTGLVGQVMAAVQAAAQQLARDPVPPGVEQAETAVAPVVPRGLRAAAAAACAAHAAAAAAGLVAELCLLHCQAADLPALNGSKCATVRVNATHCQLQAGLLACRSSWFTCKAKVRRATSAALID